MSRLDDVEALKQKPFSTTDLEWSCYGSAKPAFHVGGGSYENYSKYFFTLPYPTPQVLDGNALEGSPPMIMLEFPWGYAATLFVITLVSYVHASHAL